MTYREIKDLYAVTSNRFLCSCAVVVMLLFMACPSLAAVNDSLAVTVSDKDGNLTLHLDLEKKCLIDAVTVYGRNVVTPETGVVSAIKLDGEWFSTRDVMESPVVSIADNVVLVQGIHFGKDDLSINESWTFTEKQNSILWRIERTYSNDSRLDDTCFPAWNFADIETWTGALLDTGGVAWCRLMKSPDATYGVHGASATFWNAEKGDSLRIEATPEPEATSAMRFTHHTDGIFSCIYSISDAELQTKYDLRRFLNDKQDVWKPFKVESGTVSVEYSLSALDYNAFYDRGVFVGIDGNAVREICNTIGRIGVIDAGIMGSNGWYSGYAVLHEHWLAQMGLAINDPCFFRNYAVALDWARDHAIGQYGRVKSRWAYSRGDEMPGTYDQSGFYETQWGTLWDSQPGYVTNVAELFDFTGDVEWLRGQKAACEKVLGLALGRDSNNNGLLECMNDSHTEAKGSDWIDVVWAAFENGFVNVEMYNALLLWADVEDVLDDGISAEKYRAAAVRIKEMFNRPVAEGGLWNPEKQWYVYWRDKDGSIHGDNFVIPVNLMAVAYGLCDDPARKIAILDQLEAAMEWENLFFWPLCVYSYQQDEAYKVNWPFPNYENGDIFLAWGEVGVRAYAEYKPELAIKYVKNVLTQYHRDGLAFQRYRRKTQCGEGNDILANNLQPVTGLYRDIYGIQPKYDRLYLDPHITRELAKTTLNYPLRGCAYQILLEMDQSTARANNFTLSAKTPFAVNITDHALAFFFDKGKSPALTVSRSDDIPVRVQIESWSESKRCEISTETEKTAVLTFTLGNLEAGKQYSVSWNQGNAQEFQADYQGQIMFDHTIPGIMEIQPISPILSFQPAPLPSP